MAASEVRVLAIIDEPGRWGLDHEYDGARMTWLRDSKATALDLAFEQPFPITLGKVDSEGSIRFLLAWWRFRSDDLTNTSLVINKRFIVDFAHAQPIRML